MDRQLPLTPKILHKEMTEDILLSGVKDILPARLSRSELDFLHEALDETGCEILREAYRSEAQGSVLASIPDFIAEQDFVVLDGFEMDIREFYVRQDNGYRLSAPWLPLQVEHYLQRHFGLPVVDEKRAALLADKLYSLPDWGRSNLSSYRVMNDTCNYFFYNKPHEHVPGLMLIEVARQAMYHYFYSHSGYLRGDVSISIKDLEVSFRNYTESTYAVEVVVQHTAGEKHHQPRTVDKTAMFYQNGSLVTTLRLRGTVMKMPLFKRMRTINFPEHHWFAPSNRVLSQVLLQASDGGCMEGQLKHISLRGIRIGKVSEFVDFELRQLSIYVNNIGFLSFPIADCQRTGDEVWMAMFAKLDRTALTTLKEVIKCHCFYEPLEESAVPAEASSKIQDMRCDREYECAA